MANVVTCRFCGRAITYVRSNQASIATKVVTSYAVTPIDWHSTTGPASATKLAPSAGHHDHSSSCSGKRRWVRKAGGAEWIATDPPSIGTV